MTLMSKLLLKLIHNYPVFQSEPKVNASSSSSTLTETLVGESHRKKSSESEPSESSESSPDKWSEQNWNVAAWRKKNQSKWFFQLNLNFTNHIVTVHWGLDLIYKVPILSLIRYPNWYKFGCCLDIIMKWVSRTELERKDQTWSQKGGRVLGANHPFILVFSCRVALPITYQNN